MPTTAKYQVEPDQNKTTEESAHYLRCHPVTLRKWRVEGTGPFFIKMGRRVLYRQRDLDAWLMAQRTSSTSEYQERCKAPDSPSGDRPSKRRAVGPQPQAA